MELSPEELYRVKELFECLKAMRIKLRQDVDPAVLDATFLIHTKNVVEKLESRQSSLSSAALQQVEVTMARHGLYDAVFQQVVLLCTNISPVLGDAMKDIRAAHAQFMSGLQAAAFEAVDSEQEHGVALSYSRTEVAKLRHTLDLLDKEAETRQKEVLSLREQLREAVTELGRATLSSGPSSVSSRNVGGQRAFDTSLNRYAEQPSPRPGRGAAVLTGTASSSSSGYNSSSSSSSSSGYNSSNSSSNNNSNSNSNSNSSSSSSSSSSGSNNNNNNNNSSSNSFNRRSPSVGPGIGSRGRQKSPSQSPALRSASAPRSSSRNGNSNGFSNGNSAMHSSELDGLDSMSLDAAFGRGGGNASSSSKNNNYSYNNSSSAQQQQYGSSATRNLQLSTPTKGQHLSLVSPSNWLHGFRIDVQRAIDENRCRDIPLRECLDTIERAYESKARDVERAATGTGNSLLAETLEQHLYRAMEKRYGLRTLAAEHVGKLLVAVGKHAPGDVRVAAFQSIFRNEINEEFPAVQLELGRSIRELLTVQVMSKHPAKPQPAIAALVAAKVEGGGAVLEEEWRDMMNYLYLPADATRVNAILRSNALELRDQTQDSMRTTLGSRVRDAEFSFGYDKDNAKDAKRLGYKSASLRAPQSGASFGEKKQSRAAQDQLWLPFATFLRLVQQFQLHSHQDYLKPLVGIFQEVDTDADGVLSAQQFRVLFGRLKAAVLQDLGVRRRSTLVVTTKLSAPALPDDGERLAGSSMGAGAQELNDREEALFMQVLCNLDPQQRDRITFSASCAAVQALRDLLGAELKKR